MSKAFLKESDYDDVPLRPRPVRELPPGARNHVTKEGYEALRSELSQLTENDRPKLVTAATDADGRAALAALDDRIGQLRESIRTAVVGEDDGPKDTVNFGAAVTVREVDGSETRYRIVGVDEARPEDNAISWQSPLASALLQRHVGDRVEVAGPRGVREIEIVAIG